MLVSWGEGETAEPKEKPFEPSFSVLDLVSSLPRVFVFLRKRPNTVIMTGPARAAQQQGREPTTNSTHLRHFSDEKETGPSALSQRLLGLLQKPGENLASREIKSYVYGKRQI